MKIASIGGGSVQWTTKLTIDMIVNKTLAGAELVLHDIDADALDLVARACQRVNKELERSQTGILTHLNPPRNSPFPIKMLSFCLAPFLGSSRDSGYFQRSTLF
jgi:hypothetical protein